AKLFDWKSDFYHSINSSDYSYVLDRLELHNQKLYELSRRFGLLESSTAKDI
ncbi:uncharacterized protein METZ01_LOCUS346936, partial [marine metagenome]